MQWMCDVCQTPPPPRGFIKNLFMALSLIALRSMWPYKKFLYVLRLCWCYKPAPLKHLVVLHLRWTGVTLFCKLSQNEGAGERESESDRVREWILNQRVRWTQIHQPNERPTGSTSSLGASWKTELARLRFTTGRAAAKENGFTLTLADTICSLYCKSRRKRWTERERE